MPSGEVKWSTSWPTCSSRMPQHLKLYNDFIRTLEKWFGFMHLSGWHGNENFIYSWSSCCPLGTCVWKACPHHVCFFCEFTNTNFVNFVRTWRVLHSQNHPCINDNMEHVKEQNVTPLTESLGADLTARLKFSSSNWKLPQLPRSIIIWTRQTMYHMQLIDGNSQKGCCRRQQSQFQSCAWSRSPPSMHNLMHAPEPHSKFSGRDVWDDQSRKGRSIDWNELAG